jgi:hypothetical protein
MDLTHLLIDTVSSLCCNKVKAVCHVHSVSALPPAHNDLNILKVGFINMHIKK